ncbi:MAG TPA: hypothetical protein VFA43_25755 [Gemmatimonadaceae bacterium]|nr:hypothetical protein [Gemmatimonadaceae bacterium]
MTPAPLEVAKAAELNGDALAVLHPEHSAPDFATALLNADRFQDAVRFVAHALPKREAVWWALLCAREAAGDAPSADVKASLDATDNWVRHPGDDQRRAAMAAAQKATFETPAGCAGLAAFLSGGSLSVPGQPEVPPGPFLTAKAVTGGVSIASIGKDPKTAPERFRRYVEQGLHIGDQAGAWKKA